MVAMFVRKVPSSMWLAVLFAGILGAEAVAGSPGDCPSRKEGQLCGHAARLLAEFRATKDRDLRGSGDPQPETPWTDVLHANIDVEINPTAHTIFGTVTITAASQIDGLGEFVVYLYPNGGQMAVSSIAGDVAGPTTFTHMGDKVTVTLDQAYDATQQFTVSLNYGGVPGGDGLYWNSHYNGSQSVNIAASLSEPFYARYWWPGKDVLDDKCFFDLWFTVADNLVAVSNGILRDVDTLPGNKKRYHWEEINPMVSYLASVAVADYVLYQTTYDHLRDTMPMMFYILPEHNTAGIRAHCDTYTTTTAVLSDVYGQYPFIDEKGGMAETPGLWAFMEHQTIPSMPQLDIDWVNTHELSHQWWGDNVTCQNWGDIWLNEGMASFSEAVWMEFKPGGSMTAYWSRINDRRPSNPDAQVYVTDVNSEGAIFDDNAVYDKGAWVTHMLRHVMGDDMFFQALRYYRALYQGGSATTAEFIASMSGIFGHDLAWFTDEWVMSPGSPDYRYNYSTANIGGQQYLKLVVWQTQYNRGYGLTTMPIDIRVTTNATGAKTYRIWNDDWTEYYVIPIDGLPSQDVGFDAADGVANHNWVLTHSRAKVTTALYSPPTLLAADIVLAGGSTGDSTITLLFSEDIGSLVPDALVLAGQLTGAHSPESISYDAAAQKATIVYESLPEDLYTFTVVAADTIANDKSLDGEIDDSHWWDTTLFPSGDGQPGGDAILTFRKLIGDVDGDGDIDFDDLNALVAVLLGSPIRAADVIRSDLNSDGAANGLDIQPFVERLLGYALTVSVTPDRNWVYENLAGSTSCRLECSAAVLHDPLGNTSYNYEWSVEPPADRPGAVFSLVSGGGTDHVVYTAPPRPAYSPGGLPYVVRCVITGSPFGNKTEATQPVTVRVLGDVDGDGCTDAVDRQIIVAVENGSITDPALVAAADVNCDGSVDGLDRQIVLAVESDFDGAGAGNCD
jgi:hypothetical protein